MQTFTCGNCGEWFRDTLENQTIFDQDEGYGRCPQCAEEIEAHDKAEVDKGIKLLRDALNPKNQKKFDAMDYELQRVMFFEALEDGVIKFGFKAGPTLDLSTGRVVEEKE